MAHSTNNHKPTFNTDHPLAIINGFLIIPALIAILYFMMSIYIVISSNPSQLEGVVLATYLMHLFLIPYLIITVYFWIKRKRIIRLLMVIFFIIQALWSIAYMVYGVENEFMNVAVNIIWLIYFLKSNRVKETFIK